MKTIFINGKIFNAKDTQTFVQSMMVEDGKIIWTGMESELPQDTIAEDAPGAIRYIDLKGKTVIPGFVDAHMHPAMLAEYSKQIACLPPTVTSIADLVGEIAKVREEILASHPLSVSPKDGTQTEAGLQSTADTQTEATSLTDTDALPWIRGWGYDEGKYAEKRSPNRYDLDKGSPDLPVFLVRSCEHIRCVNSKALKIAGITKDTPDPPGGAIDRDEKGEPTGVLRENARDLVLPFMPEDTEEELIDALVDLSQLLTSQGIVGVADMGNLHPGGNYELYEAAAKKGFQQRVALYYMWDYFKDDPTFADYLGAPKEGNANQGSVPSKLGDADQESMPPKMDYEKRIRITGLKLIGDGSISGRTAWMNQPFLDGESGMPVYSDEDFESALAFAKNTGCQLSVHAMGGRAIDRVVGRMQPEEDWISDKPFADFPALRVEHLTEPSDSAMKIAAEKGFAFITQPIFEYCEIETYKANMNPERLKHIYPSRTMLERGISLAFSTDAPATSWAVPSDPFPNLKSAVTRKAYDGTDIGCGERVDVATAILLYTKKAAAVCGFAGLGQLTPGYCADFAVLSDDIFTVAPDAIDQICVEQTYINGQCVYQR